VQLARLLRRWWAEAGSPLGATQPTQQALAARLGVGQTILSRYLNPKHLSTAPLRVVEALHAQLRAPAAELEQARSLCRAALRENGRQRVPDGGGEHTAPMGAADDPTKPPPPMPPPASSRTARMAAEHPVGSAPGGSNLS
jgi:hypothetical protein